MNNNRKFWLNLTLVLALLVAPLQAVMAAQMMSGHPDCMTMSGMDHPPSADMTGNSQMKCHEDGASSADTCASDCSQCSACTGTTAVSISSLPVTINPTHIFVSFTSEHSRLPYLSSEFRPPRV